MIEKLNKHKHLLFFPVLLLLLISLNLNVFASTSVTVHFYVCDYSAFYNPASGGSKDITSSTTRSVITAEIYKTEYTCTQYKFSTSYAGFRKGIICNPVLNLYTDTNYTYDMYVRVGDLSGCKCSFVIQLWFSNSDDELVDIIEICNKSNLNSNAWQRLQGSFKTPNLSGSVKCFMMFMATEDTNSTNLSGNFFTLSPMTIEIDDPFLTGTPIETPSDEDLNNALKDYDDVMSQLPSINGDELDNLMNFDFEQFTAGMSFVRDLFERTMSTFGFNAVLVFALTIGLATYIIGRRVG